MCSSARHPDPWTALCHSVLALLLRKYILVGNTGEQCNSLSTLSYNILLWIHTYMFMYMFSLSPLLFFFSDLIPCSGKLHVHVHVHALTHTHAHTHPHTPTHTHTHAHTPTADHSVPKCGGHYKGEDSSSDSQRHPDLHLRR